MTYITVTFTIIVTLLGCGAEYATTYVRENSSIVTLKQGSLQGVVVSFRTNPKLPPVEQYKGIPYAEPPVGEFRFMPPGSAPGFGPSVRYASSFGPVCPQRFPDTRKMTPERRSEFFRLKQYLRPQSEDCLYLNIYAPYRGKVWTPRNYPVMVFIHGESFEWNSGNPYDGSVLAAYGKVIVVTLNYRLGVLGFLKAGTEEYAKSNFGLVDQIAALLWVKDNIAAFGGDPNTVTLFGHGTGAVCASLLMLSPMVLQENKTLFHRAILMSGSALSDWALVSNPLHVTYQVAQALNCQIQDDFAACLRRKRLEEITEAPALISPYRTRFGPVIDSLVVPNDPKKLMTTYNDMFRRFELMYGVTELESIHLLSADALKLGMLEKDRDQELRRYLRSRFEMKTELCVTTTLAEYTRSEFSLDDESYGSYSGHEPDRASLARDALLDILSDGRTVAPMMQMGKYHSALNRGSYFYVFTHKTLSKEYIRDKSCTGEELPYVFGVPLVGSLFHFADHYTEKERLFSEVVMTYFANFAHTGDPKMPRKNEYHTLNINEWIKFNVDWRPFDANEQWYLQLGAPAYGMRYYRYDKMKFWNEILPEITSNSTIDTSDSHQPIPSFPVTPPKSEPPWFITNPSHFDKYENFNKSYLPSEGVIKFRGTSAPGNVIYGRVKTSESSPEPEVRGISTTVTIAMCSIFLLSNLCLFVVLYLTCYRKRKLRNAAQKNDEAPTVVEEECETKLIDGCNIMKIVSKSERSDDTYEAVKSSRGGRFKVPRQMSSSTIDAHTKVRDWITNEIVYKYSPRFLRRPRHGNESKSQQNKQEKDNNSTLGRSPTRPVSPNEAHKSARPPLVKSSSIPVQKNRTVEKVSVAIDATPSGRGPSVLAQQPIELTKSLDRPNFEVPLRRSLTLEDFSIIQPTNKQELRKSTTSINLKFPPTEAPTVIRIEHAHSKSDPVQDLNYHTKKLKTFDPNSDVNVTCCDDQSPKVPLTPEESLMTIKRRNFPKVLPDYPSREALAKKRRSMPVANHVFSPIPETGRFQPSSPVKTFGKLPPAPPLRTTSTLSRKAAGQAKPVCQSAPMLAEEPPSSPEPEVTCNNLYVGPLIPKLRKTELSSSESSKLNTQPIYDKLRAAGGGDKLGGKAVAKTIITTDPYQPIKKVEPKVIIKPTVPRHASDPKKHIPRVNLHEDFPAEDSKKLLKPSQIPTLKGSSSSESTPSEESDTGTVVKRM